ncbi:MAG: hypothetical protein LBQ44_00110, partial [Treponema sp.]|nr:hypothetical protein [Treponema sp.]
MMTIPFSKPARPFAASGFLFPLAPVFLLLLGACAGEPEAAPPPKPAVRLELDRIEAASPADIEVHLICRVTNPHSSGASFTMRGFRAFINGVESSAVFLELEEGYSAPKSEASFKGLCRVDTEKVSFKPGEDSVTLKAALDLDFAYDDGSRFLVPAAGEWSFPRVQEPVFTIESIRIFQAELINTRLRVKVRIDNPNPFPVSLSSFSYELYGADRFWAEGNQKNVCTVPGKESAGADLYMVMNFTNMRREVLDRIVEMRLVRYRFSG